MSLGKGLTDAGLKSLDAGPLLGTSSGAPSDPADGRARSFSVTTGVGMGPDRKSGMKVLETLAWVYAAGFLGVFVITHTPGLSDANGLLFGLFKIDPIDDFVHLLSGVAGVAAARYARHAIPFYFKAVGVLYGLDALAGLTQRRGFLDLSLFTQGMGASDFSPANLAVNLPHVVIAGIALVIGFRKSAAPHVQGV